jgi:hypothetical protein
VATIDLKRLPDRVLADTGVVLRGFWPDGFLGDPRTPLCSEFMASMIAAGKTILIAAPSLVEALRCNPTRQVPRVRQVQVVALDELAAREHATRLLEPALKELQQELEGCKRVTVRFDAMIVACAPRYRAAGVVSVDENDLPKIAKRASVKVWHPREFFLPESGPSIGSSGPQENLPNM